METLIVVEWHKQIHYIKTSNSISTSNSNNNKIINNHNNYNKINNNNNHNKKTSMATMKRKTQTEQERKWANTKEIFLTYTLYQRTWNIPHTQWTEDFIHIAWSCDALPICHKMNSRLLCQWQISSKVGTSQKHCIVTQVESLLFSLVFVWNVRTLDSIFHSLFPLLLMYSCKC